MLEEGRGPAGLAPGERAAGEPDPAGAAGDEGDPDPGDPDADDDPEQAATASASTAASRGMRLIGVIMPPGLPLTGGGAAPKIRAHLYRANVHVSEVQPRPCPTSSS
jgi:hypothetical protein